MHRRAIGDEGDARIDSLVAIRLRRHLKAPFPRMIGPPPAPARRRGQYRLLASADESLSVKRLERKVRPSVPMRPAHDGEEERKDKEKRDRLSRLHSERYKIRDEKGLEERREVGSRVRGKATVEKPTFVLSSCVVPLFKSPSPLPRSACLSTRLDRYGPEQHHPAL